VGAGGRHNPPHATTLRIPKLNFLELRQHEVRRIPLLRGWVNKGRKRGLGLLGAPALRSRIGYFRLATLLRLGQLVPDVVLDPSGARRPLLLAGGLLAGGSPASALPSGLGQLVPDVVLGPPGAQSMVKFGHTALLCCSGAHRPVVKHPYSGITRKRFTYTRSEPLICRSTTYSVVCDARPQGATNFRELRQCEVRRIPLLRGWMNKLLSKRLSSPGGIMDVVANPLEKGRCTREQG
jgi:hypothetical protein